MERKWVFLSVCTIAHPVVFFACGTPLWCLMLMYEMPATGYGAPPPALRVCGDVLLHAMLPLSPLNPVLFPSVQPSLFSDVFFLLSNGLLWALSLWYARAALRRLRNLPPVRQPS